MKRWLISGGIAAAVMVVAAMGWVGYHSTQPQATPPPAPPTTPVTVCDVEQTIDSPGNVVNTRVESIQMPAAGRLAEILVAPGDAVHAGQTLARLDDPDAFAADLANMHVELLQAERELQEVTEQAPVKTAQAYQALLDAQKALQTAQTHRLSKSYQRASQNTLDIAYANMIVAKDALDKAENIYNANRNRDGNDPIRANALSSMAAARANYERLKANYDYLTGMPSDLEIEQADTEIQLAEAQLQVAQAEWERVKDGPDALALQQARANVDLAEARYKIAQATNEALAISAPFDGIIGEVNAKVGENISASSTLFTLIDPQSVEVQGNVVEEDYPLLSIGQPVSLYFDALPDQAITGKVIGIVPQRLAGSSPTYLVRFSLDSIPDKLVDGMTADATIVIDQRQGALCLPRSLVRTSGGGQAQVEVWNGVSTETREITIGLRGDSNVEILEGLSEGEEVVMQ